MEVVGGICFPAKTIRNAERSVLVVVLTLSLPTVLITFANSLNAYQAWQNVGPDLDPKREGSGSVVECLTRDRAAGASNLTGVTALYP